MSTRKTFTTALKTRLAAITTANGYATNAGDNVFVWRRHAVEPSETPCLLVSDTRLIRDNEAIIGQVNNILTCEIVAVLSGADIDTAHDLEADVYQCLGGWDSGGGTVESVLISKSELTLEQYGQLVAAIRFEVTAEYYTTNTLC